MAFGAGVLGVGCSKICCVVWLARDEVELQAAEELGESAVNG